MKATTKQQFCKIVYWTSDGILGDVKVVCIKKHKQKSKKGCNKTRYKYHDKKIDLNWLG
jgi:hypothetical protein